MPRPLAPHGTYSAYKRHLREKSTVCAPCIQARDERTADQREERRPESMVLPPVLPAPSAAAVSDHRVKLERNLELVTAAMEHVAEAEPAKLAPLSKRHSELLSELATLDGSDVKEDPFDAFLAGGNVTGITSAPSRKQA
jgi:hypothetical protein